jgi:SAM domain (Sterile alpha motif)
LLDDAPGDRALRQAALRIRAHRQYGVPSPRAVVTASEENVDIAAWLHGLGLQQYEQAFRDNAVDAAVLPELTADDLKDLGVRRVGHRRKLLAAIAALRSDTGPVFNTPVAASTVERR